LWNEPHHEQRGDSLEICDVKPQAKAVPRVAVDRNPSGAPDVGAN